jgi:L-ascorbate metabolism protein UlaG (beta-lactamase superfamily)
MFPRVKFRHRLFNRRTFLAGAAAAAAGGAWVGVSSSWAARFLRERCRELARGVQPAPHKPAPGTWNDNAITLAWLGHATVLINFYGVRLLTDPAFFPRIGVDLALGSLGPKRLVGCALRPEELPEIDLVLVSHAHFDHLDTPSLAAVPGKPLAVMARATSDLLPRRFYSAVHELRWDEAVDLKTRRGDITVRGLRVKHWGARLRSDTHRGYNGYILEREGKKLIFGGDTALTRAFAHSRSHGPFEAAILPIGAYNPWIANHCTPEEAVAMANAAGARLVVPVHHQSFRLSNEPFTEPIERLQEALSAEPERLALRETGQTCVVA